MEITIKLFATLRKGRFDIEIRKYSPGATVKKILDDLDISENQAAVIFVNSRHAKPGRTLSNGDIVAFFPLVGGG